MTPSQWIFVGVVAVVATERLFELRLSKRHVRLALARGGVEVGQSHYAPMVALHTALLFGAPLEVATLDRPWVPALAVVSALLLALATGLRYWTIRTLGDRWTTRVVYVAGDPAVHEGPFRWLRHPNYLAVVVEGLALPLLHTAWLTALLFTGLNAALLRVRLEVEERLLRESSDWDQALSGHAWRRPRTRALR